MQDSTFTTRPSFQFEEFFGPAFGIYTGGAGPGGDPRPRDCAGPAFSVK